MTEKIPILLITRPQKQSKQLLDDLTECLGGPPKFIIHPMISIKELKVNPVDGKNVPIPHFGIVLEWDTFKNFSEKRKNKNIKFIIEPYIRFKGLKGEQFTMFFKDPSGNALEFKSFKNPDEIFAK